jgi:GAF domain-containing protein/HAMP domain-containing protein
VPSLPAQDLSEDQPGLAEAVRKPDPAGSPFKDRLTGSKNALHIGAVAPLQSQPWFVAYLQPEVILLGPLSGQNLIMGLMAISMIAVTMVATIFLTHRITKPITLLTGLAERITAGDLWVQAPEGGDEIGLLARALNVMTSELRRTLSGMEQNIAERTAELASVSEQMKKRATHLQTIAEVAHAIASVQEPDDLLQQITSRISERFGFYHVGIFLIDEAGEWAVLRAANSEGGQRMLARGHRLRVGQEGIVGYVTGRGEARVALEVGKEAIYFDNPDLPYTRSELALPLKVGDRVFGALDVQSMEQAAFQEEEVTLLNILADQVAIAIENSRLFSETRSALSELQTLHRRYLSDQWANVAAERRRSGFAYDNGKISPIQEPAPPELWEALEEGQIIQILPPGQNGNLGAGLANGDPAGHEPARLIVPITVRGQVIGMLACGPAAAEQGYQGENGGGRRWTEEDINLVKTVADQVGLALENARLIEETQRRAEREHLVAEITGRLRASNDPQTILQTAAQELRQALRARQARFIQPDDSTGPTGQDDGQDDGQSHGVKTGA